MSETQTKQTKIVMAGSGASGGTGAVAIVAAWLASLYGVEMSMEVAVSLSVIIMWIAERIGGFITARANAVER